jgi:hypothetical protein
MCPGWRGEAETLKELERKLLSMVPEVLQLNGAHAAGQEVPFELIARKRESVVLA